VIVPYISAAGIGYLLGSLPFGYFIARARGVNIFEVGSGNPGATNVRRVLGPGPGNLVFALDVLKGAVAAGWPLIRRHWPIAVETGQPGNMQPDWTLVSIVGLVAALLGHSFSCFTRFRGGKGVATTAGGLLVLMPAVTLIGSAVWIASFYGTRYVSLASILGALALPLAARLLGLQPLLVGVAAAVGLFVVVRHRANIGRLLAGNENKFSHKKKPETDEGESKP